jgi:hypothetical protein
MEYLIGLLVTLFVILVIGGLIYWGGHQIAGAWGLPGPIMVIFDVLLVVILVVILMGMLLGSIPPVHFPKA